MTGPPPEAASPEGGRVAATPAPPYVAVIFTSVRTAGDSGYAHMAASMERMAARQPGYLGIESAREPESFGGLGITVSYWADEQAALAWKAVGAHLVAQQRGRDEWYASWQVRVAVVQRDYGSGAPPSLD